MIRVMLVDDSPVALHILQRLLARAPDIQVVGTAVNGRDALALLPGLNPDVICTDLHMPVMGGLEFTRLVVAQQPRPILVVSVSVEPGSPNVFQLLEAGAVDIFPKPNAFLEADQDKLARALTSKIRIVSGVHVFRRAGVVRHAAPSQPPRLPSSPPVRAVAIGASTGGPQALHTILSQLPAGFPVPVLCVQHIGDGFLSEMVAWLAQASRLPVRQAVQGEVPHAGVIYFPAEGAHLDLDDGGAFALSKTLPCEGHRPSATVTLRAAARCFGAGAVGVLLTGMGRDGVEGMVDIAAAGGVTIAQDEASCVVYGMPREAVARGAVQQVLPLEQIAAVLIALTDSRNGVGGAARRREKT